MFVSKVTYTGDLRTQALHLKSKNAIITDAPVDNHGKGEAFSPTDLVATALASCMLTMMGIACQTHGLQMEGTTCDVTKIMGNHPRLISEIHVHVRIADYGLSEKSKKILEHTARTCPVLLSLSDTLVKKISFEYAVFPENR